MVAWEMFFDARWEINSSRADSVAGSTLVPEALQKVAKLCYPAEYVFLVAGVRGC